MIVGLGKGQMRSIALAFVCGIVIAGCSKEHQKAQQDAADECRKHLEGLKTEYKRLLSAGDFRAAGSELSRCANVLADKALIEMIAADEQQQDFIKTISNSQGNADDRATAIRLFEEKYPAAADQNRKVIDKAHAELAKIFEQQRRQRDTELAVERKRRDAEEAAERRKVASYMRTQGVRIGMTQEEVVASSWGRPQDINRTTTAYGNHEQWVYGGRNYLYFENGKLTSIQN